MSVRLPKDQPPHGSSAYGVELLRTAWGTWYWPEPGTRPNLGPDGSNYIYYVPRNGKTARAREFIRAHDRTVIRATRLACTKMGTMIIRVDPARPGQSSNSKPKPERPVKVPEAKKDLLGDIASICTNVADEFIGSQDLLALLRSQSDGWVGVTVIQLAYRLADYGVKSGHSPDRSKRGYYRKDLIRMVKENSGG